MASLVPEITTAEKSTINLQIAVLLDAKNHAMETNRMNGRHLNVAIERNLSP